MMEPYSGKSGKITRIPRAESLTCPINSLNIGHCKNIYIYMSPQKAISHSSPSLQYKEGPDTNGVLMHGFDHSFLLETVSS